MQEVKQLLNELFEMLDWVEVDDNGTEFHPTTINSCRVMHCEKLERIMHRLKQISEDKNLTRY